MPLLSAAERDEALAENQGLRLQMSRLGALEHQTVTLVGAVTQLHAAVRALASPPAARSTVGAGDRWYRRWWLRLIGQGAHAAEWSTSGQTH